ncbi:hypothetical protein [Lysobacter terrae]
MNARFAEVRTSNSTTQAPIATAAQGAAQATSTRHVHRERDFGVGYGNSSGYGRERYTSNGFAPLFRCA